METERPGFIAVDWNGTVVPFFGMEPYPGACAVLAAVRASGLPIFVVSRAPQSVIAADVARVGLSADGVFGCTDKAPVLSDLRARYGAGLMLGDTPADQRAAAAAGLRFLQARLDAEAPLRGAAGFRDWQEAARLLAGTTARD